MPAAARPEPPTHPGALTGQARSAMILPGRTNGRFRPIPDAVVTAAG
jgi:hypothetical protein